MRLILYTNAIIFFLATEIQTREVIQRLVSRQFE